MSLAINSSLSALNALATQQKVTAGNIANSSSEKFKKSTAILEESPNGAVTAKIQQVNTPGTMTLQEDGTLTEGSNVDLAKEMMTMIPTRNAYEANLKALKVSTEMEKSTLDLIG